MKLLFPLALSQDLDLKRSLPNKEWLINVLYTITGGQHDLFRLKSEQISQDDFRQLTYLDPPESTKFSRRIKKFEKLKQKKGRANWRTQLKKKAIRQRPQFKNLMNRLRKNIWVIKNEIGE